MNGEIRRIVKDLDLGDRELLPAIRFGEKFVYRFVVCGSSCLAVYSAMKEVGSLCGFRTGKATTHPSATDPLRRLKVLEIDAAIVPVTVQVDRRIES